MSRRWRAPLGLLLAGGLGVAAPLDAATPVISEIMYHPVEEAAFDAKGYPVLDLSSDVHEFVEIHNPGATDVPLAGYTLNGGIAFDFPSNAVIRAGQFLVIARNPDRLSAVAAYGLQRASLLGPYTGQLGNRRDTVRLGDAAGRTVDSVSYSAEFPWAIGADALGAEEDWTGVDPKTYQYRGRSLERVSFTHSANDPANWIASPLPGNPTPGKANSIHRDVPAPVVVSFSVAQVSDEASVIRQNQAVRIACAFSDTNSLGQVILEWFVDNLNVSNEARTRVAMTSEGPAAPARFVGTLPGQVDRSIVRFRFLANRGAGEEVVSPRADDPYPWHAYFVSPVRSSTRPIYDCFISSASLTILNTNISQSPRRVTSPDPPGTPRASWNAVQPAVMVHNGVVYDIFMRYHGSRYNRSAGRNSFKWHFPRYRKFNGVSAIFETDKSDDFIVGHGLFRDAGFPVSAVRYVDLYLNSQSVMRRLEQGEFDADMLAEFHQRQQSQNPGAELEPSGQIYKTVGTIDMGGEGPYGRGDGRKLVKSPYWTDLQMYEWTFALQNDGWRGMTDFKAMIDAFWVARGDTPNSPNPNIPAMRAFFLKYFDIDVMLNYIALENWCCPWDDTTQNHFLWRRSNGKWGMLPWDNDAWYGRGDNTPATSSLFIGEVGDPNNNFRGPNFFKDGFIKAFRQEVKERFFLLNNTFLHPDNIQSLGYSQIYSFAQQRFTSVNQQCGLGVFQRPGKPTAVAPVGGGTALPPQALRVSSYTHSASPARSHARTVWEIRARTGSFQNPVWKLTTTNDLTSAAIPFEVLRFGDSYAWRCTFYDVDGHPSVPSDEATFTFGPAPQDVTLIPVDAGTAWRYYQSTTASLGAAWSAPGFDDSAWPTGAAVLAKEESALADPIRTQLTLGASTYYFRKHFNFPGNPTGAQVRMQVMVDDGCVVYLNGKEILRLRMADGTPAYDTLASENVGNAVYDGPFDVAASGLVQGDNVIAVEVHQSNLSSSDVVFALKLTGSIAAVSGKVVLNEIAARNAGSVSVEGRTPDWIELFNAGAANVDLGGMALSDDVLAPSRFVFPKGTVVPPQGYLVVWCDDATNAPGIHTGFGLSDQGQTVVLLSPGAGGFSVEDYVTFGLQLPDLTIGRAENGRGAWQLSRPTPNQANLAQPLGTTAGLRINEWMAAPTSGDDWFELYNVSALPLALGGLFLTDEPTTQPTHQITDLSFMGANGFQVFQADGQLDRGADHVDFKLSANGDAIALIATNATSVLTSVRFAEQARGVSQGRLPDGAEAIVSFSTTASPGEPNHLPLATVAISEVLANTDLPFEDAIELQNLSAAPVDLGGWWLSDSRQEPRKFRIPTGTTLAPGGYAVFYENQFNADTNLASSFALSSSRGDQLVLSQTDGAGNLTGYQTHVDFGPTANGVSVGRFSTSVGFDFTELATRTFGEDNPATVAVFRQGRGLPNSGARVGPVVISEIMFHPPAIATNDNPRDEFIELFNASAAAVSLFDPLHPTNTWRLRDAVDFNFPAGVSLQPGEAIVVVSFDPALDAAQRTAFEAVYGAGARLFGPFVGKLDNTDEDVELRQPDVPIAVAGPELGQVPYVRADHVHYRAAPPWPTGASASGLSLERRAPLLYGNDPANWQAATASPGRVAGGVTPNWRLAGTLDLGGAAIRVRATGSGEATLVLQRSSDLRAWTNVATNRASSGTAQFLDPLPSGTGARYYRSLILP